MIVIRVIGGLGNQMFQYALYKVFEVNGKNVKLDISGFEKYKKHNGYELERIFDIKPNIATKEEVNKYKNSNSKVRKIFNKILKQNKHIIERPFSYMENILELDNVYLDGYWQTEKYFKNIREKILEDYNYDLKNDADNNKLLYRIENSNSVSIHVRRGDYVNDSDAAKIYSGIADLQYYKKAIKYIQKKVENPQFYIFSNDETWVRDKFKLDNMHIISCNKGEDSYKDLFLMSKCKHNIIANSSFSWWAAWLNMNNNKIVITPNKWVNTCQTEHILCEDWIQI